ncbi:MAG TPA: TadE/TadG family type IV pilus assembly protein, partial [Janthinobacterium sp.]|nr:TadE/TadG family type IV pilus assembly protein [Janthinobacterium sp.]
KRFPLRRGRRPRLQSQRGVAAIELALIFIATLALLPFTIWFGRVFYQYEVLVKAGNAAARYVASAPLAEMSTGASAKNVIATATKMIVDAAAGAHLSALPDPDTIGIRCIPMTCGTPGSTPAMIEINFTVTMVDDLFFDTTYGQFPLNIILQVPYAGN